jgi:hypothetical protein
VPQALGVIDILVSGKATEYRLPQQTNQRVAAVLAVRASASISPAITLNPRASSSSR